MDQGQSKISSDNFTLIDQSRGIAYTNTNRQKSYKNTNKEVPKKKRNYIGISKSLTLLYFQRPFG